MNFNIITALSSNLRINPLTLSSMRKGVNRRAISTVREITDLPMVEMTRRSRSLPHFGFARNINAYQSNIISLFGCFCGTILISFNAIQICLRPP